MISGYAISAQLCYLSKQNLSQGSFYSMSRDNKIERKNRKQIKDFSFCP